MLTEHSDHRLKNERGNNIGDPRYTTTYTEDLKEYVEDLPAGTTEEQIRDIAARLRASAIPADIVSGRIKYRNHFSGTDVVRSPLANRPASCGIRPADGPQSNMCILF